MKIKKISHHFKLNQPKPPRIEAYAQVSVSPPTKTIFHIQIHSIMLVHTRNVLNRNPIRLVYLASHP